MTPTPAAGTPLSADALKAVRRIEIAAGRLVSELFAGRYQSTFKGRGLEFSEIREYEPGDDVRDIDWNVTARRGHPYVKRFSEERELTVMFLVDASRSQQFGTRNRTKARLAAEVAAVLSLAALKNNDKAGLLLFTNRVEKHLRPRKTRSHVLRLVKEVLTHAPQDRGTSLSAALTELLRVQKRRAVVFLISDFLDEDFEKPLRMAARKHDLVAVAVGDPWEGTFAPGAKTLLEDAETGWTAALPARGPAAGGDRWPSLEKSLRRAGAEFIPLSTGQSFVEPLLAFFRRRTRRLR